MTPLTLKSKAKAQVKTTPMFQKPITYELTEEGITIPRKISRPEGEMGRVSEGSFYEPDIDSLYHAVRALVFPKEALGEQYTAAVQMISTHMAPAKVKIRQVR